MITDYKLTLYKRYGFDIDLWERMASVQEKSLMGLEDLQLISSYVNDVCQVKKGILTNVDLSEREILVLADCESIEVFERLKVNAIEHCDNQDKTFMRLLIDSLFKKKR